MISTSKRDIGRRDLKVVADAWADQQKGINPCYETTKVISDDDLAIDLIYRPLREAWGKTTIANYSGTSRNPQHTLVDSTLLSSAGKPCYPDIWDDEADALVASKFARNPSATPSVLTFGHHGVTDADRYVSRAMHADAAPEGRRKQQTAGQLRWQEAVQETQAFNQEVLSGARQAAAESVASAVGQARKMVSKDEPPPLIAVRPQEELLQPGALFKACEADSEALALSIIRCPGYKEANVIDPKGRSSLMWAASRGFAPVCSELMSRSDLKLKTLNMRDRSDRWSALHHAAARGHDKVVFLFLENSHFSEANEDDGRGRTALHLAARYGHAGVCRMLLTHPAYSAVNALDPRDCSALHYATMNNRLEVCKVLLYHRDFTVSDVKDIFGHTAFDYAEQNGFQKLVTFLAQHPRCDQCGRDPAALKANASGGLVTDNVVQDGLTWPKQKVRTEVRKGPKQHVEPLHLKGPSLGPHLEWYNKKEWSPRLHRLGLSSRGFEENRIGDSR